MFGLLVALALAAPPEKGVIERLTEYVAPYLGDALAQVRPVVKAVGHVAEAVNWVAHHTYSPVEYRVYHAMSSLKAKFAIDGGQGSIDVSGADSSFLGTTYMQLRIPMQFHYTVDLSRIKQESIRYSAERRVLEIAMPEVVAEEPTPKLNKIRVVRMEKGWARFDEAERLRIRLVESECQERGRQESHERLAVARVAARAQLQDFLKSMLAPISPDLVVQVK